jgi:hypothetical protein
MVLALRESVPVAYAQHKLGFEPLRHQHLGKCTCGQERRDGNQRVSPRSHSRVCRKEGPWIMNTN